MDYLVSHGLSGFVGRFTFPGDEPFRRGDEVVVRSVRGIEIGEVLDRASESSLNHAKPGELLRRLSDQDRLLIPVRRTLALQLLNESQLRADSRELPINFLDAEVLHDGTQAIIQVVHWGDCDVSEIFEELSVDFGLLVTLQDLTAPKVVEESHGCSSCGSSEGGCSTGGCSSKSGGGCSTGSCSKGKVKSSEEMTQYFANLRKQMEAQSARISLQ